METPQAKIIPPPHNFPLLLTEEEIRYPLTIFRNYFSGNTLPETRELLQELQDNALSSEFANGRDTVWLMTHIQKLVEAGWLLCQLPPHEAEDDPEYDQHFTKSKSFRDMAPQDPMGVTREVFKTLSPEDFRKDLWTWLQMALSSDASSYEECTDRGIAMQFYDALLLLVDVMPVISRQDTGNESATDQINNAQIEIRNFCQTFSPHFVKTELRDWLAAAASTTGPIPEGMTREHLFELYELTNCLTDAARILQYQTGGARS